MRLPLVSRTAYGLVLDERDRLRAQVDRLTDELVRMKRVQQGMREVPRTAKKAEPEPVPPEIMEIIQGFGSKVFQDETERQVRESRQAGTPWTEIRRVLEDQLLDPQEA